MKQSLALLLCLLLPLLCLAEMITEDTPMLEEMQLEEGAYLRRYTAPDGQEILYTSWSEFEQVNSEDVNFDGIEDLVALTVSGASNAGYTFFINTEYGYQMVTTEDELFNYQLLPEYNAVLTWINEGWAGALGRMGLYVWQENELQLVRMAASVEAGEGSGKLSMYVMDLTGEEPLISWQAEVPSQAEDAILMEMENMRNALTAGMPAISAE